MRKRRQTKRRAIAARDPVAQQMWTAGLSMAEIDRRFGRSGHNSEAYYGCIDPTPQPLGCPPFAGRAGESGEARAFRRFPITGHKPG